MAGRGRTLRGIAFLGAGSFWLLAFAVPLGAILLAPGATLSPSASAPPVGWAKLLLDPVILSIARSTMLQAGASTLGSLLLGVPLGLAIREARGPQALLAAPFGVPTAVVALSWILILPATWCFRMEAVVAAHVALNAPWVALAVAQARSQVPEAQVEAARSLGAGRLRTARDVLGPYLRPSILGASAQVFALCATSFAIVLLLGGGPPVETLETAIYSRVRSGAADLGSARAAAFWQFAAVSGVWMALVAVSGLRRERLPARDPRAGRPIARSRFRGGAIWGLSALGLAPYLAILPGALRGGRGLCGSDWSELAQALGASARLALATALVSVLAALATVLGIRCLERAPARRMALALALLPSGASALVLAMGAWLAYGAWIDPFEGSFAAVSILQAALFFPVSLRLLWPVSEQAMSRELEAARTLGASEAQAWLAVEWPRWRPAVLSSLGAVAAASLGELGVASFFYSEKLVTLPILLSRWTSQYRFDEACFAASMLLLAALAVTLGLGARFGSGREAG